MRESVRNVGLKRKLLPLAAWSLTALMSAAIAVNALVGQPDNGRSVQAALETDSTLGGRVSDVIVGAVDSLRELTVGESGFWAITLTVEVWG